MEISLRGRPRVAREPDSRGPLSIWLPRKLYDQLVDAAELNHRPLALEMEYRLLHWFDSEAE
jgi:hypothetical protein